MQGSCVCVRAGICAYVCVCRRRALYARLLMHVRTVLQSACASSIETLQPACVRDCMQLAHTYYA